MFTADRIKLFTLTRQSITHGGATEMPDVDFPYGKLGENLTTEGLLESEVCIGDEFQVGTAVVRVAQPRLPCYKLGVKLGATT